MEAFFHCVKAVEGLCAVLRSLAKTLRNINAGCRREAFSTIRLQFPHHRNSAQ